MTRLEEIPAYKLAKGWCIKKYAKKKQVEF